MAVDYRYDQFENVALPVEVIDETHIIPSSSPFSIRLIEIPVKDNPSTMTATIGGVPLAEVSATPGVNEFWPDYSTSADGDPYWNTGEILFNTSRAGQTVKVSYRKSGTLLDVARVGLHRQMFTSNGIFVVPKAVSQVWLTLCGGGGGGGRGHAASGGSGGGGAGCAINTAVAVTPGSSIAVTVGAGGSGGTATVASTAGGASSFGALVSCAGGGKGTDGLNATPNGGVSGGFGGKPGAKVGGDGTPTAGGDSIFGSGGLPVDGAGGAYGYGAGGGGSSVFSAGDYRPAGNGASGFVLVEW